MQDFIARPGPGVKRNRLSDAPGGVFPRKGAHAEKNFTSPAAPPESAGLKNMDSKGRNNCTAKEVAEFIADFATRLMGSGTQTSRVVRNVGRLAESFGCRIETIVLPRTIIMTLTGPDGVQHTEVRKVGHHAINFRTLSHLRILTWDAFKKGLSLGECRARLRAALGGPEIPGWALAFIAALGNAAFCRLFGGWLSVPVVFLGTFLGFSARRRLSSAGLNPLIVFMLSAFVSSFVAGLGARIFDFHSDIALSTSVLFLVPGVPLMNGVIDLIEGHVLAGLSRLVNALALVAAMTFGLLATILLLDVNISLGAAAAGVPVSSVWEDGLFAAVAGMGFGAISNPPKRALLAAGLLAAAGHGLRFWLMRSAGFDITSATLCGAFLIGAGGLAFGRLSGHPAEIFSFPALLPMIPGLIGYKAMLSVLAFLRAGEAAAAQEMALNIFSYGFTALAVLFAIVIGSSLSVFLDTLSTNISNRKIVEFRRRSRGGGAAGA